MAIARKSFSGAAVATRLTADIDSGVETIPVAATTGWPDTAIGPFYIVIDRNTANEEKVEIASYTTSSLQAVSGGRGADGTTAVNHANNATVEHCIDAGTIDELNEFGSKVGSVTPSTSALGDSATKGTSAFPAAGDHKHAREAFGTDISTSAVGDSVVEGAAATPARSDHKHAREAFGTDISTSAPGDTVVAGTSTKPARSDHKHAREGIGTIAGRIYSVTESIVPAGDFEVPGMVTDYMSGGMELSSNGILIPSGGDGLYMISAEVAIHLVTAHADISCSVDDSGVPTRPKILVGDQVSGDVGDAPAAQCSDVGVKLTAGSLLKLKIGLNSAASAQLLNLGNGVCCRLTVIRIGPTPS